MPDLQLGSTAEMAQMAVFLCSEGKHLLGDAIWSPQEEILEHLSECPECHVTAFSVGLTMLQRYLTWEVAKNAEMN
jgi:hypothetical protein